MAIAVQLTSSGAAYANPAHSLTGILLYDISGAASAIAYNNASAGSGEVLAYITTTAASNSINTELNVSASKGIYVALSNCKAIVYVE